MSTPSLAPSAVRTDLEYTFRTSRIGALALVSSCSSSWNSGVSAMVIRIHGPTAIRAPLSGNRTRQPQDSKAASDSVPVSGSASGKNSL
jgi:hypothetical protein